MGNPSFQLLAVAPNGVVEWPSQEAEIQGNEGADAHEFAPGVLGSLAQAADARIHVLTGTIAGTFEDLAKVGLPEAPDVETDELAAQTQAKLASAFFKLEEPEE